MEKQMQRKSKREHGFTLVEVLVAMAILSFGLLAVSTMQISGLGGSHKSNSATEVSTIAMDCLEKIVGKTYAQVAAPGALTSYVQDGYTVTPSIVSPAPAGLSSANSLAISVTVTGKGRSITLNWIKSQIVQVQ